MGLVAVESEGKSAFEDVVVIKVGIRFPDQVYSNQQVEPLDESNRLSLEDRINLQFERLRHELIHHLKEAGRL
jgi:hypothetical protein